MSVTVKYKLFDGVAKALYSPTSKKVVLCDEENIDPCAGPCCQRLMANFITRRLDGGATYSDDGTYYTVNQDHAFTEMLGQFDCAAGLGEITRDGGTGKWFWTNPNDPFLNLVASGTLTTDSGDYDCPPINDTGSAWIWVNDAGGLTPDATLVAMAVNCEQASDALALPDTTQTLTVANLIGNFTTAASTTASPTQPHWDGTMAWTGGGWEANSGSQVSVLTADGKYLDSQIIQMFVTSVGAGAGSALNLQISDIGNYLRYGGRWNDPIPVRHNGYTLKGPKFVTLGYL